MTKLTKPVLAVLEKCFAAEINHGTPAQFARGKHTAIEGISVPSAVARAHDDHLIKLTEKRLPGRFPVTIRGFVLTARGRILFCEAAAREGQKRAR